LWCAATSSPATSRSRPSWTASSAASASPDIRQLFSKLANSTSYEQFSSLVQQAPGSAGLMRFLQLGLDNALALDPQAKGQAGRRLVRPIAGNPVTMGQMTRHLPDAGSYAPVTLLLLQQLPDGGTRVAYDSVASEIAPTTTRAPSRSPNGSTPRCPGSCAR